MLQMIGTTIVVGVSAAVVWTTVPLPGSTDRQPPYQLPEEHGKAEIQELIRRYCAALESMNASKVQSLFSVPVEREYERQFKAMKSLKCIVAEKPPEYVMLDYSKKAGVAQLKFSMKRVIKMAAGGAPKEDETIVTMVVSRENVQSQWLIDRVEFKSVGRQREDLLRLNR